MKKLILMSLMSCAFAAQLTPALADATSAQKAQIASARKEIGEALNTDEGCKAMCDEMMAHKKSKEMLCAMIKKDADCMKMMK